MILKIHRVFTGRVFLTFLVWSFAILSHAQFAGGQGTEADPWQISRPEHLDRIRDFLGEEHNNKFYIQTADIDLGIPPWNEDQGWIPIGRDFFNSRYYGSYDGNGFIISNLFINREQENYVALFGYVEGSFLKNITVENVNITGQQYVAALVGYQNNTKIINCSSSGIIISTHSNSYIGGLIAYKRFGDNESNVVIGSFSSANVSGGSYAGGLIGLSREGDVISCWATGNVTGRYFVGGLIGRQNDRDGNIINCYATGDIRVYHETLYMRSGGLIGPSDGDIINSYFCGRISAEHEAENNPEIGGLVSTYQLNGAVINSYWNTETSNRTISGGGEGRTTAQMIYPYAGGTYLGWDFQNTWVHDITHVVNNGYPYLQNHPVDIQPNPNAANNPQPQDNAVNVLTSLERLSWTYIESIVFTNPVGFRLYLNTAGEFGEEDNFIWIPYVEGEENYSSAAILPEELTYFTTYYWMVVPTTDEPERSKNRRRDAQTDRENEYFPERGDAENVPVWSFITQITPHPNVVDNPQPPDNALNIPITIESVGWTYIHNPVYTNPAGFRVYLNNTGEFAADDVFQWVQYVQHQSNYSSTGIIPQQLEYATTYYWQVVPTTIEPERRGEYHFPARRRHSGRDRGMIFAPTRGDAIDIEIWSFTTVMVNPNPHPATNPTPAHLASGVSIGLESLSWDYEVSEINALPAGFRVYMNTVGGFGSNAPFLWVDYVANQTTYICFEIIPPVIDPETTYYWRVVPTTIHPDERRISPQSKDENELFEERGDAENCPVWRFTTGTTDLLNETDQPLVTKLISIYPNPFNPQTVISYSIEKPTPVRLNIYNNKGQVVRRLVDDTQLESRYDIVWNGKNDKDVDVSSGLYITGLHTDCHNHLLRIVLLK